MRLLFKEQPGGGSQHLHPPQGSHTHFLLYLFSSHTPISTGLLSPITVIWNEMAYTNGQEQDNTIQTEIFRLGYGLV